MKKMQTLLLTLATMGAVSLSAVAADCACDKAKKTTPCCKKTKIESYAHPTLFDSQAQEYLTTDATYVVGGKIKPCKKNSLVMGNKKNVLVSSWAKDVLNILQQNQLANFDPKLPVLRSELAVILTEAFALNNTSAASSYKDIQDDYWAKAWIEKALSAGVMIGYPEGVFKPDQRVTKAEVFATLAKIIDVPYNVASEVAYKGEAVQYIPKWAIPATKEVLASTLLNDVPNSKKVVEDEYLSKEQVAYLVSALRTAIITGKDLKLANSACMQNISTVVLTVKLNDRISAKHANVGERFTATTTKAANVAGVSFPKGSQVTGEVVAVQRPGVDNTGFIKVKFLNIKNGDTTVKFPKTLSEAQANELKNPNILARLVGMPVTTGSRIVGIAGRTIGSTVDVAGNRVEELGDYLGNGLVELFTLHPGSFAKSVGNSVYTFGKGVFDITKIATSCVFGLVYEVGDELLYFVAPGLSNDSSLNPNEELNILF